MMYSRYLFCFNLALVVAPNVSIAQGMALKSLDERKLVALEAVKYFKTSQAAFEWSPAFQRASSNDVVAFGRSLTRSDSAIDDTTARARIRSGMQTADFMVADRNWGCDNVPDTSVGRASCVLKTQPFYVEALDPRARADTAYVVVAAFRRDSTASGFRVIHHSVRLERSHGEWRAIRSTEIRR